MRSNLLSAWDLPVKRRALNLGFMDLTRELAHELQAPLMSLELRLLKLRDELPDSELTEECLREIDALKRLVTGFLELRASELAVKRCALAPLFDSVEERFRPVADARQVELYFDAGTTSAVCDQRALERILTNLVDNAIKFSTTKDTVNVRAVARNGGAELKVEDEGVGIATEDASRIFEPFFRVDRETPGFGLGLAIAKRLAEAQRGTLRCESELGRGSSFILTLPAT